MWERKKITIALMKDRKSDFKKTSMPVNKFWKNFTDTDYCKHAQNLHTFDTVKLTSGICSINMFILSDIYIIDRE